MPILFFHWLPVAEMSAPSTMGAVGEFPTTDCAADDDDELAAFDAGESVAETSGLVAIEEMSTLKEKEEKKALQLKCLNWSSLSPRSRHSLWPGPELVRKKENGDCAV